MILPNDINRELAALCSKHHLMIKDIKKGKLELELQGQYPETKLIKHQEIIICLEITK